MRQIALFASALLFSLLAGCTCGSPPATCTDGYEGCPCSGTRCNDGLRCAGGLCIDPLDPPPGFDAGPQTMSDSGDTTQPPPVTPDPDAFWADDPPPQQCLEDGSMGPLPEPPGGTPECPDDKNREGCRCDPVGATASCWPGLRVNRNRGICHDGTTECIPYDEFTGVWGPCEGYVLPVEGAVRGPETCQCFSAGRWALENLSPCFISTTEGQVVYTVSTDPNTGQCPFSGGAPIDPPATAPFPTWTDDTLRVDCEGRFELCYTLRAGDANAPNDTDCIIARSCTGDFWYETRDVVQTLPPLPSWVSTNNACAQQFVDSGGYGEMSVIGLSIECDPIDDGSGGEYVFNRVNYCPMICNTEPTRPECENCMMGGSGDF